MNKSYEKALQYFAQHHISFDLIFLDPPYQKHLIQDCLNLIETYHLLNDWGLIICEYETEIFESSYTYIKEKKYGSKKIKIYQFDKIK